MAGRRLQARRKQRADQFKKIGPTTSEAGVRTIPVPPVVTNALKEHKLKQASDVTLVFANPDGEPHSHTSIVSKGLKPAMIRAGVTVGKGEDVKAKYPGLHALRHFYASWLINRKEDGGLGLPIKMVQERMGHASVVMTMDTNGHLFTRMDEGNLCSCQHRGENARMNAEQASPPLIEYSQSPLGPFLEHAA